MSVFQNPYKKKKKNQCKVSLWLKYEPNITTNDFFN